MKIAIKQSEINKLVDEITGVDENGYSEYYQRHNELVSILSKPLNEENIKIIQETIIGIITHYSISKTFFNLLPEFEVIDDVTEQQEELSQDVEQEEPEWEDVGIDSSQINIEDIEDGDFVEEEEGGIGEL